MVAESTAAAGQREAVEAKAELLRLFGVMGGVTARADDFARTLPRWGTLVVAQALEALVEEGSVEVASLSDGGFVYHFIRP